MRRNYPSRGVHDDSEHSPAERALWRAIDDAPGVGKPLSRASIERERTLEGYLLGQEPPAWMRRAAEIERLTRRHERQLEAARDRLRELHPEDRAARQQRWHDLVATWNFREVNTLIEQHNEWYPIERRLAIHPRTGEYVTVGGGRSYRREPLTAEWALAKFPAH